MPFALVFIGLILVVTGARGTIKDLGTELRDDFTGPGNFVWWIASIGVVGSLGYIPEFRSFSRWFMTLIILSMVLANKGFFNKLIEALNAGPEAPQHDSAISQRAQAVNAGTVAPAINRMLNAIGGDTTPQPDTSTNTGISTGVGTSISDLFKKITLGVTQP